jgi:hypothetical protein
MTVKFKETVKHGTMEFLPGVPLAFEDPDAEPYFKGAGWAENTPDAPIRTYSQDEVSVDANGTRHAESGVMMREIIDAGGDIEKAKAARDAKARAEAEKEAGTVKPTDVVSTDAPAKQPGK